MELLERSGVPEMLESWMPRTGRPRELSPREILFGMLVAIDEDRVAASEPPDSRHCCDSETQLRYGHR